MGGSASKPGDVALPATMRRIVCKRPAPRVEDAELAIEEVPLPKPKSGEVLVRVSAAPVNPSDYGTWKRDPVPDTWDPLPVGNEGCGVVVASGGGIMANKLVGKNIGFVNLKKQGAYSEFVTVDALRGAFAMPPELPIEDAASFYVNPYTAYAIVDTVRMRGGKSFVHTGAASQVGQMMVKYVKAQFPEMTLLNVVRREEQAATLRALGAEHVVVTAGEPSVWRAELKAKMTELKCTIAFDCVAGEMTEILVDALPKGTGIAFVYGRLSQESARVAPLDLIYFGKSVEGFLVAGKGKQCWIDLDKMVTALSRLRAASKAVTPNLGEGGWAASKFVDCTLDSMHADFLRMWTSSGFTDRKLRIRFNAGGGAEPLV